MQCIAMYCCKAWESRPILSVVLSDADLTSTMFTCTEPRSTWTDLKKGLTRKESLIEATVKMCQADPSQIKRGCGCGCAVIMTMTCRCQTDRFPDGKTGEIVERTVREKNNILKLILELRSTLIGNAICYLCKVEST